jgi:hypothetical protein
VVVSSQEHKNVPENIFLLFLVFPKRDDIYFKR